MIVSPALKDRLTGLGIVGRFVLLAFVMFVALVVALPLAFSLSGPMGGWTAFAAAAIVWFASAVGMLIGEMFNGFLRGANEALVKLLLGMMIRMAIPLAACMIVHLSNGPLAAAGFVFYVLGFYLVALPIDTFMSVAEISNKAAT